MEAALVKAPTIQGGHFDIFNPEQFNMMQRACKLYANSDLVPDIYKVTDKNPIEKAMANCMIAIEMSQRIGANTLMVMQNMDIIYGRPSWRSTFLIATVNTCGRFEPIKYKFSQDGMVGKVKNADYSNIENTVCIAFTTAKGSDEILESAPISMRMAIEEGWYTKNGSKWQTMPKQMLMYRSAAFWTRAYAPEISMGMHTSEEMGDITDITYEDITEKVKKDIADNAATKPVKMDEEPPKQEPGSQSHPEKKEPLSEEKQGEAEKPKEEGEKPAQPAPENSATPPADQGAQEPPKRNRSF
jgi:hypothetical protein